MPDFDLVGTVTFNQMGSSPVDCLPNLLRRAGYRTLVTTPMPGSFFNIKQAYQATGDLNKAPEHGDKALAGSPHNLDILVSQASVARQA